MHRANRNERDGTAHNNGDRSDHNTTAPANFSNSSTLGSLVEVMEDRKQPGKREPELRINQGMAIDTQGRQIILPSSQPIDIDPSAGMPGTQNMPWPGATTTRNAGTNVEVLQETAGQAASGNGSYVEIAPPTLVIPAGPQN